MLVYDFFLKGLKNHPLKPVVSDNEQSATYIEAENIIQAICIGLHDAGARKDDPIAVYSGNSATSYLFILALYRMGAVYVSLNPRSTIDENKRFIEMTNCKFLAVHEDYAGKTAELSAGNKDLVKITIPDSLKQIGADFADDLTRFKEPDVHMDDPAWIMPSGGTTGLPKGVMHTHRNLSHMFISMMVHLNFSPNPLYLVAAPMTHAAGGLIPPILALGGCARFLPSAKPSLVLDELEATKAQMIFLPPTAIYMLLADKTVRERNYSALRHFVFAASPMSQAKLEEAMEIFGPVIHQMYGQAEYPMMITAMNPDEYVEALESGNAERLSSAGREGIFATVEILDDKGTILPNDTIGEIAVRGPIAMAGYLNNPKATQEAVVNGWVRTGDIGKRDSDGYIYLLDRKKDMIITGGFNVYSPEVEDACLSHPAVGECAVIGVPDEKWGEAVKAVIELKPDHHVTAEELIEHCKKALGSVKAPKTIEIWPELPRSPVGKVLKRQIREKYWSGRDRNI